MQRNGKTTTSEWVIVKRALPGNVEHVSIRSRAEYERLSHKRVNRSKKIVAITAEETASRQAAKIAGAKSQFVAMFRRRDMWLFYSFTLAKPITNLKRFDKVMESLGRSLSRHGVRPWVIVREEHKIDGWHAHVAVDRKYDLNLLLDIWRGVAGDAAGFVFQPDLKAMPGFNCGKAAHYLAKALEYIPAGQRRYFASKPLKSERIPAGQKKAIISVRAASLAEAVQASGVCNVSDRLLKYIDNEKPAYLAKAGGSDHAIFEISNDRRPQRHLNQIASKALWRRIAKKILTERRIAYWRARQSKHK